MTHAIRKMETNLTALMKFPSPRALLFDLDGTLYRGDEPIAGASELVAYVRSKSLVPLFVTNNSTRTPEDVAGHLLHMNIVAEREEIVTSALAAAYDIQARQPGAAVFAIGERGLKEALREAGLLLVGEDRDVAGASDNGRADLVVQGLDREATYARLTEATRHLLAGAGFVQTNPDRLLPVGDGFLPGAGSLGAILVAASGKSPLVIGKPSTIIMDFALKRAGTAADQAWVVGDNPYTDLAAARNAGCPSVLVLTGLCTPDNWRELCGDAGVTPDAVCDGPEEVMQLLGNML
ncbi:HAD-IIA family hydrolase [Cohnella suwonensis]|uniref:Acid sugar phosphatase n=1 Tax=Cohnella suwonensis TaxID=696072 RepID=A0ABW0LP41_9BACL